MILTRTLVIFNRTPDIAMQNPKSKLHLSSLAVGSTAYRKTGVNTGLPSNLKLSVDRSNQGLAGFYPPFTCACRSCSRFAFMYRSMYVM